MDTLHNVMRSLQPDTKARGDHLSVFREFLAHLATIRHKAPAKRPQQPRPSARRRPAKSAAKR